MSNASILFPDSLDKARLHRLLQKLEHLDLHGQVSDIQHVPLHRYVGSSCDILRGVRRHDGIETRVAIKRLRFHVYEEGKLDKVSSSP